MQTFVLRGRGCPCPRIRWGQLPCPPYGGFKGGPNTRVNIGTPTLGRPRVAPVSPLPRAGAGQGVRVKAHSFRQ